MRRIILYVVPLFTILYFCFAVCVALGFRMYLEYRLHFPAILTRYLIAGGVLSPIVGTVIALLTIFQEKKIMMRIVMGVLGVINLVFVICVISQIILYLHHRV